MKQYTKYIKIIIPSILLSIVYIVSIVYAFKFCNVLKNINKSNLNMPDIKNVSITADNRLLIEFLTNNFSLNKKVYCIFNTTGETPSINDPNWKLSENNECSTPIGNQMQHAFLKTAQNEIIKIEEINTIGKITKLQINKSKVYVAINGSYKLSIIYEKIGNIDEKITWRSQDESIAKVDENGKVTGLKTGTTTIIATINNVNVSTKVQVTNLITARPNRYNHNKPALPCGKYSKEENDLLDTILRDRINDAGYQTRAGVVEAARFLALEFPYKIRYFSENGRNPAVDGEGRYYHQGLYLDESRYSKIKRRQYGPETWGCKLYSRPSQAQRQNGLDCSGFMTWVLLNGGFDVGDIGAGVSAGVKDLTDYGEKTRFTDEIKNSGKIKVGDLLSSGGYSGGHIAIVVGEDENNYYIAESLWTPPNTSVVILPYPKTAEIKRRTGSKYEVVNDRYYWVMLMDSYYKEDGNLTTLWY